MAQNGFPPAPAGVAFGSAAAQASGLDGPRYAASSGDAVLLLTGLAPDTTDADVRDAFKRAGVELGQVSCFASALLGCLGSCIIELHPSQAAASLGVRKVRLGQGQRLNQVREGSKLTGHPMHWGEGHAQARSVASHPLHSGPHAA